MILVDTSVWVTWQRSPPPALGEGTFASLATCGPVLQEVVQGMRPSAATDRFHARFRALPVLSDPLPSHLFLAAAEIYQIARTRGYTVRSPTDCLIAAIAMENRAVLLHRDRDFEAIAQFTSLRARRY